MAADRDRFSTATRLRAIGVQLVQRPAARVYRARSRRLRPLGRSRLTGRAALLVMVVCTLVVALAYPLRQYVSQRAEIAERRREVARLEREVDALREQKARWSDPAFVEQQARAHLFFLRPGEVGYVFQGGGRPEPDGLHSRVSGEVETRAWYDRLWQRVDAADRR